MTMNLIQTSVRSNVLLQSLFVAMVGLTLVFASGFANSQSLHAATHDMRHSTGFPCH
jgi:cobalt transporter subunit CbtB